MAHQSKTATSVPSEMLGRYDTWASTVISSILACWRVISHWGLRGSLQLVRLFAKKIISRASRALGVRIRRPQLSLLELHITHACNLTCESCSHYSDHRHSGNLDLAEADRWMAAWSSRLGVRQFNLLGGEPTIHPGLSKFVPLVRRHWPAAHIRIVTNGFFLHRHPQLPEVLASTGK